jgi:hypothetical protein
MEEWGLKADVGLFLFYALHLSNKKRSKSIKPNTPTRQYAITPAVTFRNLLTAQN